MSSVQLNGINVIAEQIIARYTDKIIRTNVKHFVSIH